MRVCICVPLFRETTIILKDLVPLGSPGDDFTEGRKIPGFGVAMQVAFEKVSQSGSCWWIFLLSI